MRTYFRTGLVFLFVWEIFSLLPSHKGLTESRKTPEGSYFASGIIHVRSSFSDGGGTPEEIARAAESSGLDFVVLTDSETTEARRRGFEKNYGRTDLFVEMENATPVGNYLTFFSHTRARELSDAQVKQMAWKHFLGEEAQPDMFLVVSHPSHPVKPWGRLDRYPEGMEVVNLDSVWRRQLSESFLGFGVTSLLYPVNPFLTALRLFDVYPKDFSAWDTLNSVSPGHFGILGHSTRAKFKLNQQSWIAWPGYEETFRLASNVVLLKEPPSIEFEVRKKKIYEGIRKGSMAIHFQSLFPFAGNDWRLVCGDDTFRSGHQANAKNDCDFILDTPEDFPWPMVAKLYKGGEVIGEWSQRGQWKVKLDGPGMYRMEVWAKTRTLARLFLRRDVPYLFYNPIYVR